MAGKYDGLARIIIQNVGGKQNINSITHCVTRLRFKLKDESKANTDILNETDGVISVIQANGQYQVVIGNTVTEVYDAVLAVGHFSGGGTVDEDGNQVEDSDGSGKKKGGASLLIDIISGIMAPTVMVMGASGIIKGLLTLFTFCGLMNPASGEYMILYTTADGFFYFLPIILGYTAAKKFNMNEFTGIALGITLCYPTMVSLTSGEILGTLFAGSAFEMSYYTTFFSIPVIMPKSGYTSSVIPIVLCCFIAAKLEKWLNKRISDMVKAFLTPVCVLVIMVSLTYLVIGPIANIICCILTIGFEALFKIPIIGATLGCAIVGGFWQVLVIFGFHWSVIPLAYINIAALGYDFIMPGTFATVFAQAGALLAVILKTKDAKIKKLGIPAFISCMFGITEPTLYGINLPKKKPFIIGCITSAIAGAFVGAMGAKRYIPGGLGLFGLPGYIDAGGTGLYSAIVVFAASVIAFALALIACMAVYSDGPSKSSQKSAPVPSPQAGKSTAACEIGSPVDGIAVHITETKDLVFSTESMGKGVGITPKGNVIVSPVSGEIVTFFPTGHAVGLVTKDGVEVLVHVGIDTVELNGKHFTAKKQQGDKVQKGEPLIEVDFQGIKNEGYDITTMVIVTNSTDYPNMELVTGEKKAQDTVIRIG
ncbi:beta-glucoside-specific PTS transporter subunit IIABC [Candidatus Merdisoma sp. JLR.KK006]|uniref:beta-glucoside-specific PTS transporter subunit IIABC n=1 Tax=Candidatus Merdisoma sp. JLR.KK006 TaxID=3112626 RepID=UPI002FEEEB34